MTIETDEKYLQGLRDSNGEGLSGVEAETYRRWEAAHNEAANANQRIAFLERQLADARAARIQAAGNVQAYASILLSFEVAREGTTE